MSSWHRHVGLREGARVEGASANLSRKPSPAAGCGGGVFKAHVRVIAVLGFKAAMSPTGSWV